MIDVALTTVTPVAGVPPRLTLAPGRKPVPVMVTAVPPVTLPLLGVIALTVGGGLPEALGAGRRTIAALDGTPLLSTRNSMYGPGGARLPLAGGVGSGRFEWHSRQTKRTSGRVNIRGFAEPCG